MAGLAFTRLTHNRGWMTNRDGMNGYLRGGSGIESAINAAKDANSDVEARENRL